MMQMRHNMPKKCSIYAKKNITQHSRSATMAMLLSHARPPRRLQGSSPLIHTDAYN